MIARARDPRALSAVWISRRFRPLLLVAALFGGASAARAESEFHLYPNSPPASGGHFADVHWVEPPVSPIDFEVAARLETAAWRDPAFAPQDPETDLATARPRPEKLFTPATSVWTAAAIGAGVLQGIGAPLQYGWESWNVTDEGWFSRNTYTGGADKISHFIISSGVSRLMYEVYTELGHPKDQSFTLAVATSFMSGLMVEIMDAYSVYGFSLQDLTVDALGSFAGALINRHHLQDLLGLRLGLATTDVPLSYVGDSVETLGHSYNDEIYAGDLKLGGLVRRLGGKPGFERFFLTSFVFFTRGYGYTPPLPTRYQEVGFEVGLNFTEILRAFGVSERTWWGQGLIAIFDFFRFPFTQIGVYYNLHDGKWYGPGAPYHYY
jgi:Predicted periplasmic lipoprotein (DUF2279)